MSEVVLDKKAPKVKEITLENLLALAEERKALNKVTVEKTLYVQSLNGHIKIKKPDEDLVDEVLEFENGREGDKYMVYSIVTSPNLRDEQLQKAYGCVEPYDIVDKLFEMGEINKISQEAMKMVGFGDSVKAIKK